MRLPDSIKLNVMWLASIPHCFVVVWRLSMGLPATRWLHDRPDYFVGLLVAASPAPSDPAWLHAIHQQAGLERSFRRALGIRK